MHRSTWIAAGLMLCLEWSGTSAGSAQPAVISADQGLDQVIEAEKAFAKASVETGLRQSFLAFVAPDGVIFRPGPVPAPETLRNDPIDDSGATLDWWPAMGLIARSGDLALSVGPYVYSDPRSAGPAQRTIYGYYATLWRRQPNGAWKFVIDGAGARLASAPSRPRDGPVERLPTSKECALAPAEALDQVRALERRLSSEAGSDSSRALSEVLADDAWMIGSNVEPAGGSKGWQAELARRPARMTLSYAGGGASSAGDLVYTYGAAQSLDPDRPLADATYLHVWQRSNDRWQLQFEGIKSRR